MQEIGVSEAQDRFAALLDLVAEGEEIVITQHGTPVARLTRVDGPFDRAKARRAADDIIQASKGVTLGGLSLKELIEHGRT